MVSSKTMVYSSLLRTIKKTIRACCLHMKSFYSICNLFGCLHYMVSVCQPLSMYLILAFSSYKMKIFSNKGAFTWNQTLENQGCLQLIPSPSNSLFLSERMAKSVQGICSRGSWCCNAAMLAPVLLLSSPLPQTSREIVGRHGNVATSDQESYLLLLILCLFIQCNVALRFYGDVRRWGKHIL